jgi:hypothetical protein
MWHLLTLEHDSKGDWRSVGRYATLNEVAAEIIRQENIPANSLFLQMNVESSFGNDDEFLGLFIYDGKKSSYTITRSRQ